MSDIIVKKLEALKYELDRGTAQLNQKQQELLTLQTTLFRIQGAIQVLEEVKKESV